MIPNSGMHRAQYDVAAERYRQYEVEGFQEDRDDKYIDGELAKAAAAFALSGWMQKADITVWPRSWARSWFKTKNYRRSLVKAGALILAEIERVDRAAEMQS